MNSDFSEARPEDVKPDEARQCELDLAKLRASDSEQLKESGSGQEPSRTNRLAAAFEHGHGPAQDQLITTPK